MSTAQPVSALESAFLALDSPDVPFVYAAVLDFEQPIPLEGLRARVDAALADVPRYRQRIRRARLRRPVWIEDDFRIARHVHEAVVAAPGGDRELQVLAAQLLATRLPPEHPPWRLWTVRGLAAGRGAVIAIIHHALVDGIAGLRMLEHVLGAAPAGVPSQAPRRRGKLALVRRLLARRNVGALAHLLRDGMSPASQLGINPHHTGRLRAVTWHTVELAEVQEIEDAFGATHNDVVLAAVAGALHRFLLRRGILPSWLDDVRAMVPVARRGGVARETAGNRLALLLARLPVREADPLARIHAVVEATRRLKASHQAAGGDLLVALSELATPGLLASVLRLSLRMRAFNLVVTNVPGPAQPLALLGSRLVRIVPIVNLWPHQALGIAVATYAGRVSFGLHVDRAVVSERELGELRDDLAGELRVLLAAARRAHAA